MVGYMNDEALRRTLTTGRVTFWSRSRQEYWRKGDTSGHVQYVKGVSLDDGGDQPLGVTLQACGNTGIEFSGIVVCSVCHTYLLFVDYPQSASLTAPGLCATCA